MNMASTQNIVSDVKDHLSSVGIYPTAQRLAIANVLFSSYQHVTADQLYDKVSSSTKSVSRATVYNSLNLFSQKKLVREVHVNASRTFYDTNTQPHHHFYNIDSGELTDMKDKAISHYFSKDLPEGMIVDDIDITVRIRNNKSIL